jgi:N-acetylglucosamine-6-phosphate deacetylase
MRRNCAVIARARAEDPDLRMAVAGIHIEGPFLSPEEGPRGAHDPRFIRNPDLGEFRAWQEAAGGAVRMVTLAPELDGALDFVRHLAAEGVVAAIGHTAAGPARIREAIDAGARVATHLGNGSHAVLPRLENYLWEQLAADDLWATMIADGFHLPAAVVKAIARVKGLDRLILISDVALHGGQPPGAYRMGDLDVEVHPNGRISLAGTPFLAGAGHLLDWDIAHFVRFTGCDLAAAVRLCTVNPARLLGLPEPHGTLAAGAPAHLTLFRYTDGDDRCRIEKTVRGGSEVFSRG